MNRPHPSPSPVQSQSPPGSPRTRPRSFDAATRYLMEAHPLDWLSLAGLVGEGVEAIEADLSTVTAAADKVLHISGPPPWLAQLEAQSNYQDFPDRFCQCCCVDGAEVSGTLDSST